MSPAPAPAASPRRRRRLLRVGLALLAVLLAIVSLAPAFVSAFGRGYAEAAFAERFRGRLEIGGLDLSWTGRQRVREARLLAPGGEEVARGELELPSLLALARGRGVRLGTVYARARADLVADDDGTTNLDRALAPRVRETFAEPPAGTEDREPSGSLAELDLTLELELEHFTWEDASTRAAGAPLSFEGVQAHLDLDPPGLFSARAEGSIAGAPAGGLRVDVRVENAHAPAGSETPPRFDLDVELAEMPVALLDGLAGTGGLLLDLMGPRARLTARAEGDLESGDVDLDLVSERLQFGLRAALADGVLRTREGTALEASLAPHEDLLARMPEDLLPAGTTLELETRAGPLTLRLRDLALPFDPRDPAPDPARFAEAARASLELELPGLRVEVGADPEAVALDLAALRLAVDLAPERGLDARLSGGLRPGARDGIDLSLHAPRTEDLAVWAGGGFPAGATRFEGRVAGLPSALVDRLAEQDGLLVDLLGDTLDLRVAGSFPDSATPLELELRSPRASVDLTALLADGELRASGDQGLEARSALTPLYTERIVGRLLPLLVGLAKPPEAPPVAVSVEEFTLPLDGDLGALNARVTLDLNQVSYRLLPELGELVSGLSELSGASAVTLEPFVIRIREGVVGYEKLDLKLGGHQLALRGTFDLETSQLDLATEVPLAALGSRVAAQLEKVRDYVDPDMRVPIVLTGTWKRPRFAIGEGFVEEALKGAAEGALRKGLRDLIDRR